MNRKSIPTGFLSLILLSILLASSCSAPSNAAMPVDDWPMFHHDPAHTGYSTSSAPTIPVVLWTSPKGLGGYPIIEGDSIFIMDLDYIYGFNATDGRQIWNHSLTSGLSVAPAFYEGIVYTPLTAYNASTGQLVLNYADIIGLSSPTIANGIIYIGCAGGLSALNAKTGNKLWSSESNYRVSSSPAVADGLVYFLSSDGFVYCLDAFTGAKIWSFRTDLTYFGYYSSSAVAVTRDGVYVGAGGEIYSLDARTGTKLWSYPLNGVDLSSPAVANGYIYTSSFDGNVIGLNASTGLQILNTRNTTGVKIGKGPNSPSIASGVVYTADSYNVFAFNASTGTKIWRYSFPPPANPTNTYYFPSGPAIANNVVYAVSNEALYAFGTSEPNDLDSTPLPSGSRSAPSIFIELAVIVIFALVVIVLVAVGLVVYFKKRKR